MSEFDVASKIQEIQAAVAAQTGVSMADVAKLLDHLGLHSAIENRLGKAKSTSDPRFGRVSLEEIRISAGMPGPSI